MTFLLTNLASGVGILSNVPAPSSNGTPLGVLPAGAVGVRFYLPIGSALTFTISDAQPTDAPASVFRISQSGTGPNWDEGLSGGQMVYVTGVTGAPLFRWF